MNKKDRILITGATGLVGSAIYRSLERYGFHNVVTASKSKGTDLRNPNLVNRYFSEMRPDYVFVAAAKVGGIHSNKMFPADFINDNLQIAVNVINASHVYGIKKLLFFGSVCAYPKEINDKLKESDLLSGFVEPTSEFYALAKITGIKMCQAFKRQYNDDFISAIPANTFGQCDNFHPDHSHVIPALIKRFHDAKLNGQTEVVCWGSGRPVREFLYVDDVADAAVFLMQNYSNEEHINIGGAPVVTMKHLAECVAEIVGFKGKILWDTERPDGMMFRCVDPTKILNLGWKPTINLQEGLRRTYDWYLQKDL